MRIFVITSRVPYPLEKGDKLRIFHQIKTLSKHHQILLCAIDTDNRQQKDIDVLKEFCEEVFVIRIPKWKIIFNLIRAFFSGTSFQVAYFFDPSKKKKIEELITSYDPDLIYCHLIRVSEYVKDVHLPKVLDYMDVFSVGLDRRIEKQPFFLRWIFRMERDRVSNYEKKVFDYFDERIIISEQDRSHINHPERNLIHIIPNGVDRNYFTPRNDEKKYDLLFTGNMNYQPNVDAVTFLAKEVLPLLIKDFPDLRVMIAGIDPKPQVLALRSSTIEVSGWVNDLRDVYAKSRIFIAPMQIGTGLQNKLLEAMAMCLPCITSGLANKALQAIHGESIIVCNRAEDYAEWIKQLLNNDEKREEIANKGYQFIINNYDWESSTEKLEKLMLTLENK